MGGLSMLDMEESYTPDNIQEFQSETSVINSTKNELERMGFEILNVGDMTISFSGPQKLFNNK
jgi:hypothetical protein